MTSLLTKNGNTRANVNMPLPLSQMVLIMLIFCFAVGVLAGGCGIYFILRPGKRVKKLLLQINFLEKDLDTYREKVSEHFITTAELVNQLTESYRNVHQHLTSGVHELCDNKNIQNQIQDTWRGAGTLSSEKLSEDKKKLSATPPKDYVAKKQF